MPDSNLYFSPTVGAHWKLVDFPMIDSVAMEANSAIYAVGDGTHSKCTSSTGNFVGILQEPITAADDDFATSRKMKKLAVPLNYAAEAYFTVGSGTFSPADEGKSVKFNDELSLAVDTAGTQARITKYIDATKGVCKFNLAIS